MSQQLSVFEFNRSPIRTIDVDSQVWFVASDVSSALDYEQAKDMTRHVDEEDKGFAVVPTPGGDQRMSVINESGLYAAVLRSRKPEAKRFKRWVTAEVLPAIRRNGGYQAEGGDSNQPLTVAELDALLDRQVVMSVADFLALRTSGLAAVGIEHQRGQHYDDAARQEVLDLGDRGWMPSEIADRTGIPINTVKTMLFRARKQGLIAKGPRQGTIKRNGGER